MLKLSIIIPVYNVEDYIASTVKSLFDQHDSAVEYIFIDDCGSDNSWQVLEDTLRQYPECAQSSKLIRLPHNGGVENARLNGLAQATGEYIWFVDSDDLIAAGAIKAILDSLAKNPVDYLAITLQLLPEKGSIASLQDSIVCKQISPEYLFTEIIGYNGKHGTVCNIVKRQLTLQYPMLKTGLKIAEDYVMHCCWSIFAESAAVLKNPVYGYVKRPQSVMRKSKSQEVMTATRHSLQLLTDFSKTLPECKQKLFCEALRIVTVKMRMLFFISIFNNYKQDEIAMLMRYQIPAKYSLVNDFYKLPVELQPMLVCDRFQWYNLMRCYVKFGMALVTLKRKIRWF